MLLRKWEHNKILVKCKTLQIFFWASIERIVRMSEFLAVGKTSSLFCFNSSGTRCPGNQL